MRYVVGGSPALNELGSELLVCDAAGQTVHRLTGEARIRFERVVAGDLVELPDDDVTAALEAAGLIVAVGDPTENVVGMSRRRALAIGAAAAAAGVVTLALPSAAAAESGGPSPDPSYPSAPSSGTAPIEGNEVAAQTTVEFGVRYVNPRWFNPPGVGVTYNYRIESPLGTFISGDGPVTGTLPGLGVVIPGGTTGQGFVVFFTAVGGTREDFPGVLL